MIKEDKVYTILLKEKSKISIALKDLEIIPNYKLKDSPDFILRIILKLSLLSQDFRIEIPLPLEVEKSGISQALEDLKKFIKKEKFVLILPMLVISNKKILTQRREEKMKVIFKIRQIPCRLIE